MLEGRTEIYAQNATNHLHPIQETIGFRANPFLKLDQYKISMDLGIFANFAATLIILFTAQEQVIINLMQRHMS